MRREWSSLVSRTIIGFAFGALATTALVDVAGAQPAKAEQDKRDAARAAYKKGEAAFDEGDYETAAAGFKEANALIPTPHAQYWYAQSLDKAGKNAEALEAYKKLLDDPKLDKIGEEKVETAKTRKAALEEAAFDSPGATGTDQPTEETPEEPPPLPVEPIEPTPPPPEIEPPPEPPEKEPDSWAELGVFGGALFMPEQHNLLDEKTLGSAEPSPYESPAWLVGARAGYFPVAVFGLEIEYAHGFGNVEDGGSAQLNAARGHVVGQLPVGAFVPFALAGAGILHGSSDDLGSDIDFVFDVGLGAKLFVTDMIAPRLDLRLDGVQKEGGGRAFAPEVLLGVSFALGR